MAQGKALIAEFVGTYFLVLTVGFNVITGTGVWAATSIASALTVMIYALGGVSGANFNPAVSLALGLSQKLMWVDVASYWATQVLGGVAAGLTFKMAIGEGVPLAPGEGFTWREAAMAEFLYTLVLCFVVLNCAASKKNGCDTGNQFYGLAIGFVIVAGGYAAGGISGGAFNPAVAAGLDASNGFSWCIYYAVWEIIGAAVAALLFRVVRPDDFVGFSLLGSVEAEFSGTPGYTITTKCVSEFIGTFVLVLTVGLNVLGESPAGAWSIAASLMSMVFSLGNCSGAHFNPAVTVAIMLSGRDCISPTDGAAYIVAQLVGGLTGGITATALHHGEAMTLGPKEPYGWSLALLGEALFTFMLCFVVLSIATVKSPLSQYFGLAIGLCVAAGGNALGAVSGGCLNPSVALGISPVSASWLYYSAAELVGAALSVAMFMTVRPEEYLKGVPSSLRTPLLRRPAKLPQP